MIDMKKYIHLNVEDEKVKEDNILINNNHLIHENLNINKIRGKELFDNDKYGFQNVLMNFNAGINITNEKIVKSNELYKKIKLNDDDVKTFSMYYYFKYLKLNESIIHDIKVYCDRIIIISFLLNGENTLDNLKIDSIGEYFKNHKRIYKNNETFLSSINELDNSYKHSFSNDAYPPRIGTNTNCLIYYQSEHNENVFDREPLFVKLDDTVVEFNNFIDSFEKFCNDNMKR